MIAAPPTTKVCRTCWTRKDLSNFRHIDKAKGRRHPECGECRRTKIQEARQKTRRGALTDHMRRMRKANSIDQVHDLILSVASELGGVPQLVKDMISHANQDDSGRDRLRVTQTLLSMCCVVDLSRMQLAEQKDETPEKVIRNLHKNHQLAPVLRQMFAAGELTCDDFDALPA